MKTKVSVIGILLIVFFSNAFGQESKLTYLALGDSYTIGEAIAENESWPNQLVDSLNKRGFAIEKAVIIAKTGWRSDELIAAIKDTKQLEKFDLVSILIGVNNQYQGKSLEKFKSDLNELLDLAIQHSKNGSSGIFALSIPDYGVTPFANSKNPEKISTEIKAYNKACSQFFEEKEIKFFDITPISIKAAKESNLLAEDQLHPSALMYQKWVQFLIQENFLSSDAFKD